MFKEGTSDGCRRNILKITQQMQMPRLRSSVKTMTLDTRKNKANREK